jgi:acyl carrier protein
MAATGVPGRAHFERVRDVMVKAFGLEEEQVTPGAHLVDDLALDSLDWAELVVILERETGRELSDEDVKGIRTVADVLGLVERQVSRA